MGLLIAIVRLPLTLVRFFWQFVNPHRTAGRIAFGRIAVVTVMIAAVIFAGYTITKKSIRLPLISSSPYEVTIIVPDAKGLDPDNEPAAAVAGTPLGRVTDVHVEEERAVVTARLNDEVRGKIFADASAAIRPASALQNLLINIDPGTPKAGPLGADTPIPPQRTSTFVTIDDVTSVLDADTQAYVQILLGEADRALSGRENELSGAISELGKVVDSATPISRTLAARRHLLSQLTANLNVVFSTLAQRKAQLAQTIDSGSRVLAITAARERELAAVTVDLAPLLIETQRALAAARAVARPLVPALDQLLPVSDQFTIGFHKLRLLLPQQNGLLDRFESLLDDGEPAMKLLLEGTSGLRGRIAGLLPDAKALTKLSRLLAKYRRGAAQLSDTFSGAFSTNDTGGPLAQIDVLKIEAAKPENLGFPAGMMKSPAGRKEIRLAFAAALEETCKRGSPQACLWRFNLKGVPNTPVAGAFKAGG